MAELFDFAVRALGSSLVPLCEGNDRDIAQARATVLQLLEGHRILAGMVEAEVVRSHKPGASWWTDRPTGRKAVLLMLDERQKASQP